MLCRLTMNVIDWVIIEKKLFKFLTWFEALKLTPAKCTYIIVYISQNLTICLGPFFGYFHTPFLPLRFETNLAEKKKNFLIDLKHVRNVKKKMQNDFFRQFSVCPTYF